MFDEDNKTQPVAESPLDVHMTFLKGAIYSQVPDSIPPAYWRTLCRMSLAMLEMIRDNPPELRTR